MPYLLGTRYLLLIVGTFWLSSAVSQDDLPLDANAVDALFSGWTQETPGGVVGIFKEGEQVYGNAFGLADLESRSPIMLETQFNIASIAKTFTAFAVLLLEEQERLSLEDDIRDYLPEMPDFGEAITVYDLLHHFSGIRNWNTLVALQGSGGGQIDHQQVFSLLTRQRELNHPPGERESYSNSNYYLLARIVEEVSGQTFRYFMEENVFSPLGMDSTYIRDSLTEDLGALAVGYRSGNGESFVRNMPQNNVYGSSNLVTTLHDFARWERNLSSPTLGSVELINKLFERGMLSGGARSRFAKGTGYNEIRGMTLRGMGGSTPGYISAHNQLPDLGLTVVIMTNASYDVYTPYIGILELCCDSEMAQIRRDREQNSERFLRVEDQELVRFSGAYKVDGSAEVLIATADSGSLTVTGFEFPLIVKPVSGTDFESVSPVDDSRISFDLSAGDTGNLTIYRDEVEFLSASKIPTSEISYEYLAQFIGTYRSPELGSAFDLVTRGGALYRTGEGFPDRLLNGRYADLFVADGNTGMHLFERDANGNITGFRISIAGVNNLLYEKVD